MNKNTHKTKLNHIVGSVVTNTMCLVFKYFAKYSTKLSI